MVKIHGPKISSWSFFHVLTKSYLLSFLKSDKVAKTLSLIVAGYFIKAMDGQKPGFPCDMLKIPAGTLLSKLNLNHFQPKPKQTKINVIYSYINM